MIGNRLSCLIKDLCVNKAMHVMLFYYSLQKLTVKNLNKTKMPKLSTLCITGIEIVVDCNLFLEHTVHDSNSLITGKLVCSLMK